MWRCTATSNDRSKFFSTPHLSKKRIFFARHFVWNADGCLSLTLAILFIFFVMFLFFSFFFEKNQVNHEYFCYRCNLSKKSKYRAFWHTPEGTVWAFSDKKKLHDSPTKRNWNWSSFVNGKLEPKCLSNSFLLRIVLFSFQIFFLKQNRQHRLKSVVRSVFRWNQKKNRTSSKEAKRTTASASTNRGNRKSFSFFSFFFALPNTGR